MAHHEDGGSPSGGPTQEDRKRERRDKFFSSINLLDSGDLNDEDVNRARKILGNLSS